MQKHVNLVDLVKSFPTNIYLQNLASIQKRTSLVKFAHLAEKSGKGSVSNLSTKAQSRAHLGQGLRRPQWECLWPGHALQAFQDRESQEVVEATFSTFSKTGNLRQ